MTEQKKISFVFFTEWRHLIKDLPPEVKIEIYEGLSDYVETGEVSDMSPMAAAVFPFLKKRIDENNQKFEEVSQRRKDAREKRNKAQQNSTKIDFVEDCKAKTENADNTQQNSTKSDFVSICKQKTENADKGLQTPYENENENENVSSDEDNIKPHTPIGVLPLKGASSEPKASFSDSAAADAEKVPKSPEEIPSPPGSAPPPSPIEKRERTFRDSLAPFVSKYGEEMIRAFCDYWTERNKSGTKMRFEMEKTWDTARRLVRWDINNNKFKRDYAGNTKPVYGNKAPEEFGKGYWSDDI